MSHDQLTSRSDRFFFPCAALVALGGTILFLLTAKGSWFFEDDLRNLSEAHETSLGWSFLVSPIVEARLAPGHRLLDWLVVSSPVDAWHTAVAIGAACLFASAMLMAVTVRDIAGSPPAGLLAAFAFVAWVGWGRTGLWWAASAHLLPSMAFSIAAVLLATRWLSSRGSLALLGSLACTLIALSFSMRAMVIPLLLLVLLIVSTPSGLPLTARSALSRARATGPILFSTAAVVVVYTALDLRTESQVITDPATTGQFLAYLADWMTRGLGAVVANARPSATGSIPLASWGGLVILLALMLATIRNRRSALTWVGIFGLIAFCGLQVGHRLSQAINEGAGYGYLVSDLRFHEGDVLVLALLVPAAWGAAGKPVPAGALQRRLLAGAALLLVCIWAAFGYATREAVLDENPGALARVTDSNIRSSVGMLSTQATGMPSVIDTRLPNAFVPIAFGGTYDGGLPRLLDVLYPELGASALKTSGVPAYLDSDGKAVTLRLDDATRMLVPSPPCAETTGPEAARGVSVTAFRVPRATVPGQLRILDLRFARASARTLIRLSFTPAPRGSQSVDLPMSRQDERWRVLVPPLSRQVSFGSPGGEAPCPIVTLRTATPD